MKKNEPIVLWEDRNEIDRSIKAHKEVAKQLLPVLKELSDMGVELSQMVLNDLFEKGEFIKGELNKMLEKDLSGILLPSRKEKARAEFNQVLSKVDQLVQKVDKGILKRNIPFSSIGMNLQYVPVYIKASLFTWTPDLIIVDEQSIIDSNSVYLESEGQKKILEMAKDLISKIDEFNRAVTEASMSQVRGMGRQNDSWNLIEFYSDNSLEIDYESFKHIG
jgi:hypothetical protein